MKKQFAIFLTALLICSYSQSNITTDVSAISENNNSSLNYSSQLSALDQFNALKSEAEECLICDLNSDGNPEVIIQTAGTVPYSAVFSVDENGAFMAEPAGGTAFTDGNTKYSYDGSIPQSFINNGQDQYFAECRTDNSIVGGGGIIKLNLNGRQLTSEYIAEYSYNNDICIYNGFENEEQYNDYIYSYFKKLEPQWKKMPRDSFSQDIDNNYLSVTVDLLKEYHTDRNELAIIEEQLGDDLPYKIEFKSVYEHTMSDMSFSLPQVYSYDYAGNIIFDSNYGDYFYTYYPNGKIKSKSIPYHGFTEYDEEGRVTESDDIFIYDEKGRLSEHKEFLVNREKPYRITKYFYNDDTDEIEKKIMAFLGEFVETTFYENGLETRIEHYSADKHDNAIKHQHTIKKYTPDGYTSETIHFDKKGNILRSFNSEYDNQNGLIKQIQYGKLYEHDGTTTDYNDYYYFNYDTDGKRLSEVYERIYGTDVNNKEKRVYEYIYDKYGNVLKEIKTFDSDDKTVSSSTPAVIAKYIHEFDFAKNIFKTEVRSSVLGIEITEYQPVRVIIPSD